MGSAITKKFSWRWIWILASLVGIVSLITLVWWKSRETQDCEMRLETARRLVRAGRFKPARTRLEEFIQQCPDVAESHALMAQVELDDGDLAEVTKQLNLARSLGFPESKLERIHALVLSRLDRFAEAEAILIRQQTSNSEPDPLIDEALARIYLRTYRLTEAQAAIDRWSRHAPEDGRPFLWLTEIDRRFQVEDMGIEESHYRQALDRDPDLDAARLGLAEVLFKLHRNEEAASEFNRYLERHPRDSQALARAGLNALQLNDLNRATKLLDAALELDPDNVPALKGRGMAEQRRGKPAEAGRWLDRALKADPYDTELLYTRSLVRSALGDPQGAAEDQEAIKRLKQEQGELLHIRDLLMKEPNNPDLRSKVAAWMFAHGREDEGLGWAKSILAMFPRHAATNRLLADYYTSKDPGLANYYRMQASSD
jgi:tetratricopeptide (TPR) repeat protein